MLQQNFARSQDAVHHFEHTSRACVYVYERVSVCTSYARALTSYSALNFATAWPIWQQRCLCSRRRRWPMHSLQFFAAFRLHRAEKVSQQYKPLKLPYTFAGPFEFNKRIHLALKMWVSQTSIMNCCGRCCCCRSVLFSKCVFFYLILFPRSSRCWSKIGYIDCRPCTLAQTRTHHFFRSYASSVSRFLCIPKKVIKVNDENMGNRRLGEVKSISYKRDNNTQTKHSQFCASERTAQLPIIIFVQHHYGGTRFRYFRSIDRSSKMNERNEKNVCNTHAISFKRREKKSFRIHLIWICRFGFFEFPNAIDMDFISSLISFRHSNLYANRPCIVE